MSGARHAKFGGVIVAGGRAARMGGIEKPLQILAGRPMLEQIVERVRPQVDALAIDVREPSRDKYRAWQKQGIAILSDPFAGDAGPLGGVIGGLQWLESLGGDFTWLATFPGDTPFLPRDLVARLRVNVIDEAARPIVAVDANETQNLCALWPLGCLSALDKGVRQDGLRSVRRALEQFDAVPCKIFSVHAFTNVNTDRDLADAERLMEIQPALD